MGHSIIIFSLGLVHLKQRKLKYFTIVAQSIHLSRNIRTTAHSCAHLGEQRVSLVGLCSHGIISPNACDYFLVCIDVFTMCHSFKCCYLLRTVTLEETCINLFIYFISPFIMSKCNINLGV